MSLDGLPMESQIVQSWKLANRYDQAQHPRPWRAWFDGRWEVRDGAGKIVASCDSRGLAEAVARLPDLLDGALDIGGSGSGSALGLLDEVGVGPEIRERLEDL